MLRCAAILLLATTAALPLAAQQPPGVYDALNNLSAQPSTHFAFTFDRNMLQSAQSLFGPGANSSLSAITIENYRYSQPAFYTPEAFAALVADYSAAGWKHLVNANATPAANAQPVTNMTDLWLHFQGTEIDDVTVLLRGPRDMHLIEISGVLRPLDLVHLGGHFGIPKVDPNAVMVPAPPGH